MALTLVEYSKLGGLDPITAAVVEVFAQQSDILRVLPFENIEGNAHKFNREKTLPGVGFRGLNEGYTESGGVFDPIIDALTIAGGDLDVDKFLVDTGGEGTREQHEVLKIKALAHTIGHKVIKGDSSTAAKEFDGLQKRLTGTQLLAQGSTSGGDVLTLAKLDELIDLVDSPTHLLMSKAMRRTITAAARTPTVGGYVEYTKDEFGRQVTKYNDLPILIADANADLFATLGFDEANPGGGSSVGTSIYCLSIGPAGVTGIQSKPMEARDLGELETKPVLRTRVEWYPALSVRGLRAAARLYGIKAGAATA